MMLYTQLMMLIGSFLSFHASVWPFKNLILLLTSIPLQICVQQIDDQRNCIMTRSVIYEQNVPHRICIHLYVSYQLRINQ